MTYALLLLIVLVAIVVAAVLAGERADRWPAALQYVAVAASTILLLILTAGCASTPAGPVVRGDADGGVVYINGASVAEAHAAVKAHCASYGKRPGPAYPVDTSVVFGCA